MVYTILPLLGLVGLVLVFVLVMVIWLVFRRTRRRHEDESTCGNCGYNVHGLPTFICPECGADLRDVGIIRRTKAKHAQRRKITVVWLIGWTVLGLPLTGMVAAILDDAFRAKGWLENVFFGGAPVVWFLVLCCGVFFIARGWVTVVQTPGAAESEPPRSGGQTDAVAPPHRDAGGLAKPRFAMDAPPDALATVTLDGAPPGEIGSYRIEREIGRGGMGVVYLAQDRKLNRSVAIKSLPAGLVHSPTVRARFEREAKLLASLNHPNIAMIYQLEERAGSVYLILEYVPGPTLAERIAQGPLPLDDSLAIAAQVAAAVSAAHERGVIHRDLKPGNIKITPEGNVKVLDFGLAKAITSDGGNQAFNVTITQPGRVVGSPAYMSPEQARGRSTDQRTDVWSFGCVLYEMLTGGVPFTGESISDVFASILTTEPDWTALLEAVPARVGDLLRACLQKDISLRLNTMSEAVQALRVQSGGTC